MDIGKLFTIFPTQESCFDHLERVLWDGQPECPYCFSKNNSLEKSQHRYHCNSCNTSFSVTVNTIFHNTKLPLQKWFFAIFLMLDTKEGVSSKQIERKLDVTYKTAWNISVRIRRAIIDQSELLQSILEIEGL